MRVEVQHVRIGLPTSGNGHQYVSRSEIKMSSEAMRLAAAFVDWVPIPSFIEKDRIMTKPAKFTVEVIEENDKDAVLDHLKEFFFKDEPLNDFLELGECKELETYSTQSIYQRCSFKAVNDNGEIIGVMLNGIVKRPSKEEDTVEQAADCQHPKFKKILGLMDFIDSQFNIFDLYPDAERVLDGKIVSVNGKYRGMGLAGELIRRSIDYIKENNIPLMHVICTSHLSARVLEKLNFEEVYKLPYIDYVQNGEQVLNPVKPHENVRILIQRV